MARRSMLLLFLPLLVLLGLSIVSVNWLGAQEDEMKLGHKDAFEGLQRPAVNFSHQKHADIYSDCLECHHIYEYKGGAKKNVWGGEEQKCSDCHKLKQEGSKLPLREAFHENCSGCHRGLTKENKKSGPATCGECHIRPAPK
jgi:hypothetical protein